MISKSVTLRPELINALEHNAQQEDRSLNELVNEALEYYLHVRQIEKINQEITAYEKMHGELKEKLLGH